MRYFLHAIIITLLDVYYSFFNCTLEIYIILLSSFKDLLKFYYLPKQYYYVQEKIISKLIKVIEKCTVVLKHFLH